LERHFREGAGADPNAMALTPEPAPANLRNSLSSALVAFADRTSSGEQNTDLEMFCREARGSSIVEPPVAREQADP
jgi:hypothetical protein